MPPWRSEAGSTARADPWAPERSVWPLLEVVGESLDESWLAPLAAHLRNSAPEGETRRFASVRHIADLYDRYSVHRPEMLRSWLNGDADHPNAGWQPELWRRLRNRIGEPSPAERLVEACARLEDEPSLLELPARLSLFGLTRLPASYLDVLDAIAAGRDVHLFLLHPSPVLWANVAAKLDRPTRGLPRAEDPTTVETNNPLLASWGRDAEGDAAGPAGPGQPSRWRITTCPSRTPTVDLLHRLQADVRADRRPPGLPRPGGEDRRQLLDPSDRSVQVHACHGRARQVEVIRDTILHLLAEDPTLEPRDVIVMCPDIDTFAPSSRPPSAASTRTDGEAPDVAGTFASGSPTGRCARPTRCSASSPSCSISPARVSPPPRCSTSPVASRCAGGSASTTTTSRGSRSGSSAPASAGVSTPSTGRRSSSSS